MVLTIFLTALGAGGAGLGSDQKLPVIGGKKIVAAFNEEAITLEEFNRELASIHAGMGEREKADKRPDVLSELLRRLINTRLIILEARRMGLDELPEIKEMVDAFSKVTLREQLMERRVKNIKADGKEVERLFREFAREWKIKSVMIEKEEDAKRVEEEIRKGKSFDEAAKRVLAEGIGKGEEGKYLKDRELLPEVAAAVSKMNVGSISPMVKIDSGFVILKLENVRYPEDKEARERARQEALHRMRAKALEEYDKALKKKYVKVDQKVLDSLDYVSKEPGFQKLREDQRVVAEVKGEKPITVGELTETLRQQFYHGIERAIESKRVNDKKAPILEEMLHKRVFRKEALRLDIDKTDAYRNKVKEYENSVIFGAFVQKALVPEIKIKEGELKAYYKDRIEEFTTPEMMRIRSLIFHKRERAENAIEKLRKGTEFKWMMANAEGQVDSNAKGLLNFENRFLTTSDFSEKLRKAIAGSRQGDFRLYASAEGYFYVLNIQEVAPPKPQPFIEAREAIAKTVYNDKLKKALEDWAEKLRAATEVKVYLKEN